MKEYIEFGKLIKDLREKNNQSPADVARAIKKDRTYISKLEGGKGRPSMEVLSDLIQHFSLSDLQLIRKLFELAGYNTPVTVMPNVQSGIHAQSFLNLPNQANNLQIELPPNMPILYSDSAFLTASNVGLVFDFAQHELAGNKQTIVGRIGMSYEHAKMLWKILGQKLEEGAMLKKIAGEKDH